MTPTEASLPHTIAAAEAFAVAVSANDAAADAASLERLRAWYAAIPADVWTRDVRHKDSVLDVLLLHSLA